MKVQSTEHIQKLYNSGKKAPVKPAKEEKGEIVATGIGISIRHKGESENVIQKNSPTDPLVSKKILDALDLGLVTFKQEERDALATILHEQAEMVRKKR